MTIEELRKQAGTFFQKVVDILVDRHVSRGDSFRKYRPSVFEAAMQVKLVRVMEAIKKKQVLSSQDLEMLTNLNREIEDGLADISGYAALWQITELGEGTSSDSVRDTTGDVEDCPPSN